MKKRLLLIFMVTVVLRSLLTAQDTIPDLIISEERLDWSANAYIELTNMGDSALDLSQFILSSPFTGTSNIVFYFEPNTMLDPKESYVLTNIYEEQDQNWVELQALADQLVYQEDAGYPNDSISVGAYILQSWNGRYTTLLWYKSSDVDSMIIDCFNWNTDDAGGPLKIQGGDPIAGVVEPVYWNTLIRKSSVTQGNLGLWDEDRGVDAADSKWLLAEHTNPHGLPYTTVGNHGGDYTIDVTSGNPDVIVDLANGTLTVPWGIYKGDSIIRELNLGDGMAWWYVEKPVFEDSIHNIMQTGDILQLKSFTDTMIVKDLVVTVSDPKDDMNQVFPLKSVNYPDPEVDPPGTVKAIGGTRYYVTQGMPGLDTIGNVPYAARVDTLFKYLEWASNVLSVDIIWKDWTEGPKRVDVMNGDILEVTAANGAKKQYYIDVQDYAMSDDVSLSAITWPDIKLLDYLDWISDTLPGFAPNKYNYNVTLRFGTANVPALKAYSQDLNAKISYKPAISLKGGLEERTTVITVTSESDTISTKYFITFKIEERDQDKQKFYADPFFTEMHERSFAGTEILELVNPGTEPLDLSQYLITRTNSGDAESSLTQTLTYLTRYKIYVPGYRFSDDTTGYENEDYKKLVLIDNAVDPIVEPGGVFLIGGGQVDRVDGRGYLDRGDWDIFFDENIENKWGITFAKGTGLTERNTTVSYYLWKIENDTILQGNKAIGDLNDLTLIDALGHSDGSKFTAIYDWDGNTGGGISIIRKSSVSHGNPSYVASGGTTPEDSEWIVRDRTVLGYDAVLATINDHVLDPITSYMSTVSSLAYLVDKGYQGDLGIIGIGNGETVQQFYDNLIFPDTGQVHIVKTGTSGDTLALTDPISQGDTLVVISADGSNVTKYKLDITPLDDNTNLVPADGSSLTVSEGKVSGFSQGTTLESVLAGIKAESEFSILNVLDDSAALVPVRMRDSEGNNVMVIASSNMSIEVVAQNGDREQYQLKPDTDPADAFVLSSIYDVDQETRIISGVPGGTATSAFHTSIVVAEGASATILDKAGYARTLGNVSFDDVLMVTSGDGMVTKKYFLHFIDTYLPSFDATLSDLTSGGTSVDGFVPSILEYTVGLPGTTTEVPVVNAITSNGNATVTLTQAQNLTGTEEERTATVHVMAESGNEDLMYKVTFVLGYVPSSNARLSDLTVDAVTVEGFAPANISYTLTLPIGTSTVPAVAGMAEDDSAAVEVTQAVNLDGTLAERTATVEVTAEDGSKLSYTVIFDLETGIDDLWANGPQVYSVGHSIYIRTKSINDGDRAAIYDLTGQLVKIRVLRTNLEEIHMDSHQGIYIVKLLNADKVTTTRVSVIK